MWRVTSASAASLFVVIFALMPVDVALAKDSDCWKKRGEVQILACTRIIKSKRLFGKRISKNNLARICTNRGLAYASKGQNNRAIADYDRALQLNPKLAHAYNNRGVVYSIKGQYDRASADCRKALEIDPYHKEARRNLHALGITL